MERFTLGSPETEDKRLTVPAWLWNSEEWAALTAAAPQTQRPLLMQALRELRGSTTRTTSAADRLRAVLADYDRRLAAMLEEGPQAYGLDFQVRQSTGDLFTTLRNECDYFLPLLTAEGSPAAATQSVTALQTVAATATTKNGQYYNSFTAGQVQGVHDTVVNAVAQFPANDSTPTPITEDSPVEFDVAQLPERLRQVAARTQSGNQAAFISTLVMRIETILGDQRIRPLVAPSDGSDLDAYLSEFLGSETRSDRIAVIDLSLIPADVLHLAIAVLSRILFEAIQRHRRLTGTVVPTTLVLEEAHRFIRARGWSGETESPAVSLCRDVFERIAREGRKFGMGLLVSSQRPTELSSTVLSQCNSYLLHRLVNGSDQDAVARVVPDTLGGMLSSLPSLPAGEAIALGAITPLPVLVRIHYLPDEHRPQSDNPPFWATWVGENQLQPQWNIVAADWQGRSENSATQADADVTD